MVFFLLFKKSHDAGQNQEHTSILLFSNFGCELNDILRIGRRGRPIMNNKYEASCGLADPL